MPTATLAPDRLRAFGHGTDQLELPVDVLGRHRFRSSLAAGSVAVHRSADPAGAIGFVGTSILFNKRTWIGSRELGFWEQIAPTAISQTLTQADIRFLQNHNPDLLLARTNPAMRAAGAATLTLTPTPSGLRTEADMAPVSYAADLAVLLERGDISQMSFAFDPIAWTREELEDGSLLITITELRLYDVSVVTYPAYEETDAGLRAAAFDALCRSGGLDPIDVLHRYAQGGPMPEAIENRAVPAAPSATKRDRLVAELRDLNGWTLDALWPLLDQAVVEICSTETFNAYWYVWLVDISDTWLVYCDDRPGATFPTLMQVDYTIDANGTVTLGTPIPVVAKTAYLPIPQEVEDEPGMGDTAPAGGEYSAPGALEQRTLETRHAMTVGVD